ncbi:transglutaminase [Rhodosalinus halophilus]|uniref:Transglutaminase n=1 Tax=Rhodosalinus halophilus TaxID=2259333 RepID=A0A365U670_9RHOB|nr:transglutaminase-like cysteine peptidase [Rhodosalinus halophilus]RBI83867.1 transglutaminase [Rhodosalinus halophilus]
MTVARRAARAAALAAAVAAPAAAARDCGPLDLPVARVEAPPVQYAEFCARHPDDCVLSGPARVADARERLARVNREVNDSIRLLADQECLGVEEHWDYPRKGVGDCEDFALEKRRRLVAAGLPSAALTMAIVHHRTEYFGHAVLLAETERGTLVLDNLTDALRCWSATPYRFERRERPDGLWTRFARE